jgi:IS30 family transposase
VAKKKSRQGARHAAELRRTTVGQFLKAGMTQREIAKQLGVSPGTVNRDIQILRERWRQEQFDDVEQSMLLDLARIEDAIRAITQDVRSGNLPAIDRLIRLIELRAQLLGYKWLHQAEIDWRVEAVKLIQTGQIAYHALEQEIGNDLATQLFEQAGVAIAEPGDAGEGSAGSEL